MITDHLGSTRLTLSTDAAPMQSQLHNAFGEVTSDVGEGARTGYIGREHDVESDLGFYGVRLYEPEYGRFMSTDPLWGMYITLQPYQYSLNDPIGFRDVSGAAPQNPKPAEILVTIQHPYAALVVAINAGRAKALTERAMSDRSFGDGDPGRHNGPADAFRHTLWQALNARDLGMGKAKLFGDAHEQEEDQPESEKRMDLHNNWQGYLLGKENKNATDEQIVTLVLNLIKAGKLKTEPVADKTQTDTIKTSEHEVPSYYDHKPAVVK